VISNDGVHFREPVHERVFLEHAQDGAWDQGGLLQGQGFENVGDQTYIYYGAWDPRKWQNSPPRGGVGIATLPRDRFADLVVDETTQGNGDYHLPEIVCEFITTAVAREDDSSRRFFVNCDGLGDEATLKIELLSHTAVPLPEFSGGNAAIVRASGFQTPIVWNDMDSIRGLPKQIRVKVTLQGKNNTNIRFSALYVQ
jgi:hypothetical protein